MVHAIVIIRNMTFLIFKILSFFTSFPVLVLIQMPLWAKQMSSEIIWKVKWTWLFIKETLIAEKVFVDWLNRIYQPYLKHRIWVPHTTRIMSWCMGKILFHENWLQIWNQHPQKHGKRHLTCKIWTKNDKFAKLEVAENSQKLKIAKSRKGLVEKFWFLQKCNPQIP